MLSACYAIHLKPPLYLRNALPIDISISVAGCTVANTDDVTEAKETSQVDGGTPVKKNVGLELSPRDDFLDYGEKVVKPGDVLHLPTVKTTVKEGDNKSYLVARVSFSILIKFEYETDFWLFSWFNTWKKIGLVPLKFHRFHLNLRFGHFLRTIQWIK